jgi:DNA-binding PadR family transcriptional regulator
MRRGHVRYALLVALADGPAHGYELMGKLEEKSGGMWHPSPGSVYPTLQLLEDEGLVKSEERDGKRVYELTDTGREQAKTHAEHGGAPWEGSDEAAARFASLRDTALGLMAAAMQVAQAGTDEQVAKAEVILRDARKGMYQILAED